MRYAAGDARVIVQNPEDRDALAALGIDPARLVLIRGSGVDTAHFAPLPEPRLGPDRPSGWRWSAACCAARGCSTRSRRCAGCAPTVLAIELVLAGPTDPDNPDSLDDRALAALAAEPGVVWLGRVEDVREVWAEAAIAVLPSTYGEGLPKSLLEAAACGRAIVASDMPGCREIVRPGGPGGETGLLVPPGDVAALAEAIAALAARPGTAARDGPGRTAARRARVRRGADRGADPGAVRSGVARAGRGAVTRVWLAIAGLAGLASVLAGALAAHVGADPRAAELLRTGALYGMVHAAALVAVIALAQGREPRRGPAAVAGWSFAARDRAVQRQPVRAGGRGRALARLGRAVRRRGADARLGRAGRAGAAAALTGRQFPACREFRRTGRAGAPETRRKALGFG